MKKIGLIVMYIMLNIQAYGFAYAATDGGAQQAYGKEVIVFPVQADGFFRQMDGQYIEQFSITTTGTSSWYCPAGNALNFTEYDTSIIYTSDSYGPCVLVIDEVVDDTPDFHEVVRCLSGGGGSGECGLALKTFLKTNPLRLQVLGVKRMGLFDRGPLFDGKRVDDGTQGALQGAELEWISANREIPLYQYQLSEHDFYSLQKLYSRWKGVHRDVITIEGLDTPVVELFKQFEKDQIFIENYLAQWSKKFSSSQRQQVFASIIEKLRALKIASTNTKTLMYLGFIENALRELGSTQ